MKEKDFEDIGKRLYGQEAEPPKDGMKKIRTLMSAPVTSGKLITLSKHWWKPLVIILPLTWYWLYDRSVHESGDHIPLSNPAEFQHHHAENPVTATDDSVIINKEPISKHHRESTVSGEPRRLEISNNVPAHQANQSNSDRQVKSFSGTTQPTGKPVTQAADRNTEANRNTLQNTEIQPLPSSVPGTVSASKIPPVTSQMIEPEKPLQPTADERKPADSVAAQVPEHTLPVQSLRKPWRLSAFITPHIASSNLQPITDDDIYITQIASQGKADNIGYGIGLGAGRMITSNLYLDGHVTYQTIRKNLQLTYATGNIDTLLATQMPDQTVVVTPVYEQAYQESRNQFGYIGTRLTAHYYFWQKPRSRFHFLASAGFHYLVTADIQQQINGEWVSLSDANLNRENFSIAIGAGYNLTWNKGWELMISPVLTSYTQKVKNQSLPFTMDQQLMGLTIMLSKTLNPAK